MRTVILEIDDTLPAPTRGHYTRAYKLINLQVGESVLMPADVFDPDNARFLAHQCAKRMGQRVATRRMNNGMRVWRTE